MKLVDTKEVITHELILSVHKPKKPCSYLTVSGGFFDGLWSDQKEDQTMLSYFTSIVLKNGARHKEAILEICSFILEQEYDRGLSGIRLSTGKYLNDAGSAFYDNSVDIDFSKLHRENGEAQLQAFIARVLSYNKIIKKEKLCKLTVGHTHLVD